MKRDMDLIREIMLAVEQSDAPETIEMTGHARAEVGYQVQLMRDAGLIVADLTDYGTQAPPDYWIHRLTWDEHEFLDAARDESRYRKAVRKVVDCTGGLIFEVLKSLLVEEAKKSAGLLLR